MVILRTLGKVYDITEYLSFPLQRNDNIVGLEDTALIEIPYIEKDALQGLDLSRKIPLYSIVEIDTMQGLRQYYIEASTSDRVSGDLYKHILNLIEPKAITKLRPIPDFAITQPANISEYVVSETSSVMNKRFEGIQGGIGNNINFTISQISNDTSIIENRVIKKDGKYTISFSFSAGRINGLIMPAISKMTAYIINGLDNNQVIHTHEFGSFGNIGWAMVGTQSFTTTLDLVANTELKVVVNINGYAGGSEATTPIWLNISSGYMTVDKIEQLSSQPIYMDQVVDKILSLSNVSSLPEFKLNESSRSKLSQILAYDEEHTEATIYSALERVASYVKARLYIDIVDYEKIVRFEFYEDMSKLPYVEANDDTTTLRQISNEYLSGVTLQNNNVIRDNTLVELSSVRTINDTTSQLTTDNISAITKYYQDRIKKFEVKGKEIKDTNDNIVLSADTYLDITNNVIEKTHYETLDKYANYDNRMVNNQNNHIYYVRSDNKIYNMSFIGSQFESFTPNNSNRAIYEAMATVLQRANPNITIEKFIDKGLEDDVKLEFRIEYYAMSQSNAIILKDDQTGFQEKLLQRLNANDRVNNVDYLGSYARTKINSIGGTERSLQGYAYDLEGIVDLGTISPLNERVVSITTYDYKDYMHYYITLVKDYVFQSHYKGIDSDRRLLHIPRDEYVKRIDKSLNVIGLYLTKQGNNESVVRQELFMSMFNNNITNKKAPKTSLLIFDDIEITGIVDVGSTANTIEWYLEMQDNYSAGNKRAEITNGDKQVYYQYGVAYSNLLGNAESLFISYKELLVDDLTTKNEMPEGNHTTGIEYSSFGYQVKKDAREQIALSLQTSILSYDDKIYVYNGIGKFNDMANHISYNVDLAILNYIPNRDDKYIDIGRITPQNNNTTVYSDYIETNIIGSGLGYAFYERNSNELILAVIKNVESGNHRVYFKGETYGFYNEHARRSEINTIIDFDLKVYGISVLNVNKTMKLDIKNDFDFLGGSITKPEVELNITVSGFGVLNINKVMSLDLRTDMNHIGGSIVMPDIELKIIANGIGLLNVNRTFSLDVGTKSGSQQGVYVGGDVLLDISSYGWNVVSINKTFNLDVDANFGSSKGVIINTTAPIDIGVYNYSFGKSYSAIPLKLYTGFELREVPTPPDVFVSYTVVGNQVRWDMLVYNFNSYPTTVLYSASSVANYIDGGVIQPNNSKNITGFRYTKVNTPMTVYGYARLRNSQGNLSDIASGSRFYKPTQPTQATWQYNGSSSQPICFSQPEKWIGTPCSNVGETVVINGKNEGYSDSCIELICKL